MRNRLFSRDEVPRGTAVIRNIGYTCGGLVGREVYAVSSEKNVWLSWRERLHGGCAFSTFPGRKVFVTETFAARQRPTDYRPSYWHLVYFLTAGFPSASSCATLFGRGFCPSLALSPSFFDSGMESRPFRVYLGTASVRAVSVSYFEQLVSVRHGNGFLPSLC